MTDFQWDNIWSDNVLEEEPPKKTSDRYKYCGRKFKKTKAKNGKKEKFTFICDDFRNCSWCLKEKVKVEKQLLYDGLVHHLANLVVTRCSEAEAKKLRRRQRDKDLSYRSYPQPDDECIVLHCDESEEGEVIDNEDDFHDLPIDEWLKNIPEGKRVSGRGKMQAKNHQKKKDEGEYHDFWTFALWTNASEKEENECWEQAVSETHSPLVWEEVADCVIQRNRRFKHILEEKGFVTYCVPVREKVLKDSVPKWV